MIDLGGKRVLITGGSRGIGAACARLFAASGATVLVQFREGAAAADALLAEVARPAEGEHLSFRADLSRPEEISALFAFAAERWNHLDVLINNAGVWVHGPLASLSFGQLQQTLAVNLSAPFLCTREALPLFERAAEPSIVNVSSTAAQRGEAFYSAYAATKGALQSATKSWAVELAPHIRVNAVAPGWVMTDMTTDALAGEAGERVADGIPLGRIATADDIAGPILFLASPLARHITGEVLNVNGGSVLCG